MQCSGFALVSVLVISFALFMLLSMALTISYRAHKMNRRFADETQARASALQVIPSEY
jgi:hypothetical protein